MSLKIPLQSLRPRSGPRLAVGMLGRTRPAAAPRVSPLLDRAPAPAPAPPATAHAPVAGTSPPPAPAPASPDRTPPPNRAP